MYLVTSPGFNELQPDNRLRPAANDRIERAGGFMASKLKLVGRNRIVCASARPSLLAAGMLSNCLQPDVADLYIHSGLANVGYGAASGVENIHAYLSGVNLEHNSGDREKKDLVVVAFQPLIDALNHYPGQSPSELMPGLLYSYEPVDVGVSSALFDQGLAAILGNSAN